VIGLCQYGAEEGRVEEQPLMVKPDAVTISTIHSVKGLVFAAVFLADVQPQRFPSSFAKRVPQLPLDGNIVQEIDVVGLADNDNNDGERGLMYVALTRAERFLLVSHSGSKTSRFIKELRRQRDERFRPNPPRFEVRSERASARFPAQHVILRSALLP
jgi:DNA helicase-2/ATP-dependent DNA helicase PcrA